MRPWATWCIKHGLKWVVLMVWGLTAPLYLLAYAGDAWRDWRREGEAIRKKRRAPNV